MFVLGCKLRSHARNENECQTPWRCRWAANIEIHDFNILVNRKFVWNSWNLTRYHGMAVTCRGKNIVPFGAGVGYKLLANQSISHNKPDAFSRVRATLGDETIYVASSYFQNVSRVNIEQHECCVSFFRIFRGSFWHFHALIAFSMHLWA